MGKTQSAYIAQEGERSLYPMGPLTRQNIRQIEEDPPSVIQDGKRATSLPKKPEIRGFQNEAGAESRAIATGSKSIQHGNGYYCLTAV